MADKPTLYWINGSIPSWQVTLAALEKGVAYEGVRLRVMGANRETRAPAFLAINPRGQAPAWVEPDGTIVTESMAILMWLESAYPEVPLLPEGGAERATALVRVFEVERLRAAYRPLTAEASGASTAPPPGSSSAAAGPS